jgi:hypothetical protein
MDANRRNVLGILGLAAGGAVSTEALADKDSVAHGYPLYVPGYTRRSPEYQDLMATALENLAKAIRMRDALGIGLVVTSKVDGESFLEHELKFTVELPVVQRAERIDKQAIATDRLNQEANQLREEAAELKREAEKLIRQAKAEAEQIKREQAGAVLMRQSDNSEWAWVTEARVEQQAAADHFANFKA